MKNVKITDPKVTVKEALSMAQGNQSHLARMLDVTRAAVNLWIKSGRRLLPTEHAYRIRFHYPYNGNPPYKTMIREWKARKGGDAK